MVGDRVRDKVRVKVKGKVGVRLIDKIMFVSALGLGLGGKLRLRLSEVIDLTLRLELGSG